MTDVVTGFDVLKWAAKARDGLTATTKIVLISLASYADGQGACWPSLPSIAADSCLTVRAVRKALRELETLGYLSCSIGTGRGHQSRYRLLFKRVPSTSTAETSSPERGHVVPKKEERGSAEQTNEQIKQLRCELAGAPDARDALWKSGIPGIRQLTG